MLKYKDYLQETIDEIENNLSQFKISLISNLFYKISFYVMKKNYKIHLEFIGYVPIIIIKEII